jgi:hypothetical protein
VVRVHTDGFITKQPLPLKLSPELGGWKKEKEGKATVINVNTINWN